MGGTPINLTLVVTAIYVVTYVLMDPVAGSLAAGLVLLLHRFTFGQYHDMMTQTTSDCLINMFRRSCLSQCPCSGLSSLASSPCF